MHPSFQRLAFRTLAFLFSGLVLIPLSGIAQRPDKPLSPDDAIYLVQPANPALPTLFIIGDSTVRNGNGTGKNGEWGWGDFLAPYFNTNRLNVVNVALGGTSSRTFYRDRWPGVKTMLKPGDVVLMQFGHNDSSPVNETVYDSTVRSRGTIDGIGPEFEVITNIITKRMEVVHSYGWYLERFIAEARAHGATPMVCSPIPRNEWNAGRIRRDRDGYAGWAGEAARIHGAAFLDLNGIIARQYELMGKDTVAAMFVAGAGPHTSRGGARINAACVISALKALPGNPLTEYFSQQAQPIAAAAPPPTGKDQEP